MNPDVSFSEDVNDSTYSIINSNFRNIIEKLPSIEEWQEEHLDELTEANEDSWEESQYNAYFEDPNHEEAVKIEETAIAQQKDKLIIDWDSLIQACKDSISARNKIEISEGACYQSNAHDMLLLRTYTLLLNFEYAKFRLTKNIQDFEIAVASAEELAKDRIKTWSLEEEDSTSGTILSYLFKSILTYYYFQVENNRNNFTSAQLAQIDKEIRFGVNVIHDFVTTLPGQPARVVLLWNDYKSLIAGLDQDEEKKLRKFVIVLSDIVASSYPWSHKAIGQLIEIFLKLDFNQLKKDDKTEWAILCKQYITPLILDNLELSHFKERIINRYQQNVGEPARFLLDPKAQKYSAKRSKSAKANLTNFDSLEEKNDIEKENFNLSNKENHNNCNSINEISNQSWIGMLQSINSSFTSKLDMDVDMSVSNINYSSNNNNLNLQKSQKSTSQSTEEKEIYPSHFNKLFSNKINHNAEVISNSNCKQSNNQNHESLKRKR